MKINNAQYRSVLLNPLVPFPLKAGTPLSLGGNVANSSSAIGIVPQTIPEMPLTGSAYILVAGDVELAEVEREYGSALTADAKAAMNGIRFFGDYGADPHYLEKDEAYVLPAASDTEMGGVLKAAAVASVPTGESADAEDNADAINAILAALKASGAMNLVTITTQPESAGAAPGEQASFTVVAVGDGLSYDWQYATDNSEPRNWETCKDLGMGDWDTATLGPFEVTQELADYYFRCAVTGHNGSAYQTVYTVTVKTK